MDYKYAATNRDIVDAIEAMSAKLDQLLAKKKPAKPRSSKKHEYSEKFEAIWKDYPKVSGANKQKAYAAYQTRLKEHPTTYLQLAVSMHMAVIKYAEFCKATDRFVMLPATFFGPSKHYDDVWTVPKKKPSEDPDKQHHKTFDPDAKVVIPDGIDPYEGMK